MYSGQVPEASLQDIRASQQSPGSCRTCKLLISRLRFLASVTSGLQLTADYIIAKAAAAAVARTRAEGERDAVQGLVLSMEGASTE